MNDNKNLKDCSHRTPCGWCDRLDKPCMLLATSDDKKSISDIDKLIKELPVIKIPSTVQPNVPDYDFNKPLPYLEHIPNCCKNCNNHPSNGGSGICNCVLPYMETSTTIGTISKAWDISTSLTSTGGHNTVATGNCCEDTKASNLETL